MQASPVQVHAVADQPKDEQVAADVPLQGGVCLEHTGQPAACALCGSDTDAASLYSILKHRHAALQSTGSSCNQNTLQGWTGLMNHQHDPAAAQHTWKQAQ